MDMSIECVFIHTVIFRVKIGEAVEYGHRRELALGGSVSIQNCSSSLKAENWSGSAPLRVGGGAC